MSKLRIKVDCASKVQWMFCDLKSIKTILDLSARIKERYSVEELFLSLDDAVLPDKETIEILNNGDLIKVNLKKNAKKSNGKICQSKSSSSSSSSSNSSSEDEVRHFKQSSKETAHIPEKTASPRKITIEDKIPEKPSTMVSNDSSSSSSTSSEDEDGSFEQSFKGTDYLSEKTAAPRKVAIEDKIHEKPSTVSNGALNEVKVQSDDAEKKSFGSLDALLKLAEYPIKARAKVNAQQKNARKDVCTNKSVVLTNKNIDFQPDNLEQYPPFDNELSPQSGEVFAFLCLQIGPDYTPQMTRYVGELKQIEEGGEALFLILYDENEGKDRCEKFELDSLVDGLLLKNREVNFLWSQLSDIRKIK